MKNKANTLIRAIYIFLFLFFASDTLVLFAQSSNKSSATNKISSQKSSASKKKDTYTTVKCSKCGGDGVVTITVSPPTKVTKRKYSSSSRDQYCKDNNCWKHTRHTHSYQCKECEGKGYIVKKK